MNQKDLTKGPVLQSMLFFALPMIFGNLLQQGYNIADTWLAGNFIGKGALAAVGSAFALMTFLTSVLLGLCMGSGVVFSRCFGRQDAQGLRESICASFLVTAAAAAAPSRLWPQPCPGPLIPRLSGHAGQASSGKASYSARKPITGFPSP